jgi:multidrug efflux pump subunit AcrB
MLMSLLVAFTITPWLSYHMLRSSYEKPHGKPFVLEESLLFRVYSGVMEPVFARRSVRLSVLGVVLVLLGFAGWLVVDRHVPLKMLPFDNKNELQVVVDMDEGTTLEATEAAVWAMASYLTRVPEVTDVCTYVGTSSPMDFNGLVRHYYLRRGPNVADIRFNLLEKKKRGQQSHAIALRLRNDLEEIAKRHNAKIKIVEVPPGPPVISTLVAEVYGPLGASYDSLAKAAKKVREHMERMWGVVDVDDVLVAPQAKMTFRVDNAKAALHGIQAQSLVETLQAAVPGLVASSLRLEDQVNP